MFSVGLSSQIGKLEIDTSTEGFLLPTDPVRIGYSEFRKQFGCDEILVIEVRPPEIFSLGFLEKLRAFHLELERNVPYVDKVTSLLNARETRGEGDTLVVRDLLEKWPSSPEELADLEQRVLANELYRNVLISQDGKYTAVMVETNAFSEKVAPLDENAAFGEEAALQSLPRFITGEESAELIAAIDAITARYQAPDFDIHIAGAPLINTRISQLMERDMRRFFGLSLLMIGVVLFILFRRAAAIFLPLLVVSLSISSTLGAMAIIGEPLGVPTQIMPSFLLAVGIGATVHLLVVFFQRYDRGASQEDALAYALGHSGLAIVMTSLTTAGGLISFVVAEIAPVALLGIFTPIGILLGLAYTLILLPALLATIPLRRRNAVKDKREADRIERALVWIGGRSVEHPWQVIIGMSCFLLFAIAGIPKLKFDYDPVSWYPEESTFRKDIEVIDADMGGALSIELVVDTGLEDGLLEPELMNGFDTLRIRAEQLVGEGGLRVTQSISLADILKEINQALNENRAEFYAIPQDRQLIAQEILLFENSGSDDLEDVTDSQFRQGRISLKIPYAGPAPLNSFVEQVGAQAREVLGDGVVIHTTGSVRMMSRAMMAIRRSLATSYLIALAIITPLMIMVLGTLRSGLTAMVPNVAPVVFTMGLMGWCGIPLDAFTLLIGSIAIGLAVDDTIHFMHNFRKYYEQMGDVHAAVCETLRTTGHAMLVTSIVLSLGFFIYMFASLENLFYFGLLTGFTICTAFIADVTISPAVMTLLIRYRGDVKSWRVEESKPA